jgi:hypothetical protein
MRLIALCTCVLCAACAEPGEHAPDSTTARAGDSALGASRLPGAGGVSGSLRAVDSAEARNARLDSIDIDP